MFNFLVKSTTNETNKRVSTTSDVLVKSQNNISFSNDCLTKINHKPGNYIYIGKVVGEDKIIITSLDPVGAESTGMGRVLSDNNSFTNKNLSLLLKGSKSEWNVSELVHSDEDCKVYQLTLVVSGEEVQNKLEQDVVINEENLEESPKFFDLSL